MHQKRRNKQQTAGATEQGIKPRSSCHVMEQIENTLCKTTKKAWSTICKKEIIRDYFMLQTFPKPKHYSPPGLEMLMPACHFVYDHA